MYYAYSNKWEQEIDSLRNDMYNHGDITSDDICYFQDAYTDYNSHLDLHVTQTEEDKVALLDRLCMGNEQNRTDGYRPKQVSTGFSSQESMWDAVSNLIAAKSSSIIKDINNVSSDDGYQVYCAEVGTLSGEPVGKGYMFDENGYIHNVETDYVTIVLQHDNKKAYNFNIVTAFPGLPTWHKDFKSAYVEVENDAKDLMHHTDFYKEGNRQRKAYCDIITDDSRAAKASLSKISVKYNDRTNAIIHSKQIGESNGAKIYDRIHVRPNGMSMSNIKVAKLFNMRTTRYMSETSGMNCRYAKVLRLPSDTKSVKITPEIQTKLENISCCKDLLAEAKESIALLDKSNRTHNKRNNSYIPSSMQNIMNEASKCYESQFE